MVINNHLFLQPYVPLGHGKVGKNQFWKIFFIQYNPNSSFSSSEYTDKNNGESINQVCKFKRGGVCIEHGLKGTKVVDSMKVWTQKKNGLYG